MIPYVKIWTTDIVIYFELEDNKINYYIIKDRIEGRNCKLPKTEVFNTLVYALANNHTIMIVPKESLYPNFYLEV